MKTRAAFVAAGSALVVVLVSSVSGLASQTLTPTAPAAAAAGDSDNGKRIFVKYGCAECHGREGQGAPLSGPRIAPAPLPLAGFVKYVRSPTGQMPPYTEKVVTNQELTDMRAFLLSRARPPAGAQSILPPE
jgi:mono/diheme cytochrome c family protein